MTSYTTTTSSSWLVLNGWRVDKCLQMHVRLHLVGKTVAQARAYLSKIEYSGTIVPATGSDDVVISSVTMCFRFRRRLGCGLRGIASRQPRGCKPDGGGTSDRGVVRLQRCARSAHETSRRLRLG